MVRTRFILLPLFSEYRVVTSGNLFTSPVYIDVTQDKFSELLGIGNNSGSLFESGVVSATLGVLLRES